MGKVTKRKQQQAQEAETTFQVQFARRSVDAKAPKPVEPAINHVIAYSPYFLRSPNEFVARTRSNNPNRQLLELVRHLFVRYKTPRILEQAWELPDEVGVRGGPLVAVEAPINPQIDFKAWYICVAGGGSLYKTLAKPWLTRAETHLFLHCPHAIGLSEALVWAIARAGGAGVGQALRLARSSLGRQQLDPFWTATIRFFAMAGHCPASAQQTSDLVDFLRHQRAEQAGFKVLGAGFTLDSLMHKMEDWHRALRRAKVLGDAQWTGHAIEDSQIPQKIQGQTWQWEFHQITSARELAAEGSAMRHCVFSYKAKCQNGDVSIWSLRLRDPMGESKRKLTLELNRNGRVAQMRGLANRSAHGDETHIVARWAMTHGLIL